MRRSTDPSPATGTSRRTFLRNSSLIVAGGAIAASQVNIARAAHAFGSDTIKIGMIGCGGRCTQAVQQAMNTTGGEIKPIGMADAFEDRLKQSLRGLSSQKPKNVDVSADKQFVGLDGYKGVVASHGDIFLLARPPGF